MKQFWIGIIGAVIGGFVLFLVQNTYQAWSNSARSQIEFNTESNAISLSEAQLKNLNTRDNSEIGIGIKILPVTVRNVGSEDISDKTFSAPVIGVLLSDNLDVPNDNPKNVSITSDEKLISIKYRLLPSGSVHKFWIATDARYPTFRPKFSADSSGVSVSNSSDFREEFPWFWLFAILATFAVFFLGIFAGSSFIEVELKKRGIDAKEALKRPEVSSGNSEPLSPS